MISIGSNIEVTLPIHGKVRAIVIEICGFIYVVETKFGRYRFRKQ